MQILRMLRAWVQRPNDPRLAAAQVRSLSKQIPILYAIVAVDTIAVAFTHLESAPVWLTVYPPIAVLSLCAVRTVAWIQRARRPETPKDPIARLRATTALAAALAIALASWAVLLSRYGGDAEQMHVLFCLTITMIACVSCLIHLYSASLIVALIALPAAVYFSVSGVPIISVTAVNFAAVAAVMMYLQYASFRDFNRLVRLSDENDRLAHVDALTGLPNRRCFFNVLDERAGTAQDGFAVVLIDLDGFKPVNDTFGHGAGDEVLRQVGRRLERALDGLGWAARLGGDEFGVIVEGQRDLAGIGRVLRDALSAPYRFQETTAQVGASIGIAERADPKGGVAQMIEQADYALYRAKACNRGGWVIFTSEHAENLRKDSVVEQGLRQADIEAEFHLAYQPIMDPEGRSVIAFEALARWTSPRLGQVSPGDFIPVAERAGLIHSLTLSLLRKALAAAKLWPEPIALSFNLSSLDIATPEAAERVCAIVQEIGFPHHRLILEVTETSLMRDVADARRLLDTFRSKGISVALDDFGCGYSSLSYLRGLPLDKIKVDRSFITDLVVDRPCRDILQTIFDLCRNLDLTCVVEGVETAEQHGALSELGTPMMQGYLFQRPIPAAEIDRFLASLADRAAEPVLELAPAA